MSNTDKAMELLPCPFCGSAAHFIPRAASMAVPKDRSDPKFGVAVICGDCMAESANVIDECAAARRWNARTHIEAMRRDCRTCRYFIPAHTFNGNCKVSLLTNKTCTNHNQWTPVEFKQLTRSET